MRSIGSSDSNDSTGLVGGPAQVPAQVQSWRWLGLYAALGCMSLSSGCSGCNDPGPMMDFALPADLATGSDGGGAGDGGGNPDAGDTSDGGVDGGVDLGPDLGCIASPTPDVPDDKYEDTNCDGIDGDKSTAIFVAPTGDDMNAGTPA